MTVIRRYSNVAVITAITAELSSTATTFDVYNSTGYPDPPFSVEIDNEVILVQAKSSNTFSSLERGFDGTAAAIHPIGTEVEHVAIADDFNHRWQELILTKPRGAWDEEFDLDTKDASWVEATSSGTAVWTQENGVMSALYEDQSTADLAALVKPVTVISPMYIETAVRLFGPRSDYNMAGLVLADGSGTTANCVAAMLYDSGGTINVSQRHGTIDNLATTTSSTTVMTTPGVWLYIRLHWRSTNTFNTEWSSDGTSWTDLGFSDTTKTFTPNHVGLWVSSWSGTATGRIGTFEYLRVVEI